MAAIVTQRLVPRPPQVASVGKGVDMRPPTPPTPPAESQDENGERMSSRDGAAFLSCLKWASGASRWDPRSRRGRCYHCGGAEHVRRNLCVQCRITSFSVTATDVIPTPLGNGVAAPTPMPTWSPSPSASSRKQAPRRSAENAPNPYLTSRGYRYCQGNCSTIPRPLSEFAVGESKKCLWCLSRQAGKSTPSRVPASPGSAKAKFGRPRNPSPSLSCSDGASESGSEDAGSRAIGSSGAALAARCKRELIGIPLAPGTAQPRASSLKREDSGIAGVRSLKKAASFSVKRKRSVDTTGSAMTRIASGRDDAAMGVKVEPLSGSDCSSVTLHEQPADLCELGSLLYGTSSVHEPGRRDSLVVPPMKRVMSLSHLPTYKADHGGGEQDLDCSFHLDEPTTLSSTPMPLCVRFDDLSFDLSFSADPAFGLLSPKASPLSSAVPPAAFVLQPSVATPPAGVPHLARTASASVSSALAAPPGGGSNGSAAAGALGAATPLSPSSAVSASKAAEQQPPSQTPSHADNAGVQAPAAPQQSPLSQMLQMSAAQEHAPHTGPYGTRGSESRRPSARVSTIPRATLAAGARINTTAVLPGPAAVAGGSSLTPCMRTMNLLESARIAPAPLQPASSALSYRVSLGGAGAGTPGTASAAGGASALEESFGPLSPFREGDLDRVLDGLLGEDMNFDSSFPFIAIEEEAERAAEI